MQHLDEGTIHAWLDGELPADEAEKIAAHANDCPECGALVAEARGLIAASTRILTALDDVPAGVVPSGSGAPEKPAVSGGPVFRRHWYDRTDLRAAAAVLFVAGASLVAVKAARNPGESAKGVAMTASSAGRSELVLQDSGAPVAADVEQPQKFSEVKPTVGAIAPAEQRRGERQVAASPPALSSKVALREPAAAAATAPAIANAMDAVAQSNAMSKLRSDAPVSGRVQGQVMDKARGKGLPAVNVIVEGTKLGATTDEEGRFTIDSVPAGDRRLTARRIGYMAQTVPLAVKEETGATATVTLAPAPTALEEVIVSGVAATAAGATAKGATTPSLRVVKVDSTGTNRSVVYEVSPGVQVTLVEAPLNIAEKDKMADQKVMQRTRDSSALAGSLSEATRRANAAKTDRAAAAPAPMVMSATVRPQINTISWIDQNRRYTLSGPLEPAELEAIKARLMKLRR